MQNLFTFKSDTQYLYFRFEEEFWKIKVYSNSNFMYRIDPWCFPPSHQYSLYVPTSTYYAKLLKATILVYKVASLSANKFIIIKFL